MEKLGEVQELKKRGGEGSKDEKQGEGLGPTLGGNITIRLYKEQGAKKKKLKKKKKQEKNGKGKCKRGGVTGNDGHRRMFSGNSVQEKHKKLTGRGGTEKGGKGRRGKIGRKK